MDLELFNELLAEYIEKNLSLAVETSSEYTGDMDGGGSLYRDRHTVQLVLNGAVISSVSL